MLMKPTGPPLPIALALLASTPLAAAAATTAERGRLARDVMPTSEVLRLVIDPEKPDYSGSARVDLRVVNPTRSFSFHARRLKLESVVLGGPSGDVPVTYRVDEPLVTVTAAEPLAPGSYTLDLAFSNNFGTQATALYRVVAGGNGYVFSQFEPDDARQAFPCWDEPSFKIPYQVTLVVPEGDLALSNTPIATESAGGGTKTVAFKRSPPLPSYLVALAVGPFETIPIPGLSVPGRVVSVKGTSSLASEAARVAPPLLSALERYFGRPYPYEKLDLIAVPEYAFGAMENAGAITFLDALLLFDPKTAGFGSRKWQASIMAHEMAHMWFGDLVTMEWWDDVWLNESFASWMGDKVTNEVFPEFEVDLGQLRAAQRAMATDALLTARAVRRPVSATDNLLQSFDELAYAKGEAVLGTAETWLGQEAFRSGVLAYLGEHEWANARAADLFGNLARAARQDVSGVMAAFLDQPGVPLVTAQVLPDGRVELKQQRFVHYGVHSPGSSTWQMPIALSYSDGNAMRVQKLLLTRPAQTVTLEARPVWIHPNAGENGYYRWSVPSLLLRRLADQSKTLDPRERVGLVARDPHPEVVAATLEGLSKARDAFVTPDLEQPFASYVRRALGPALQRFGRAQAPGEAASVSSLRGPLLEWLGREGKDPSVLDYARTLAAAFRKDPASVDGSLVFAALALTAYGGDRGLFEAYRHEFEQAQAPLDRQRYLVALASFEQPELVDQALRYALTPAMRAQEVLNMAFMISRPERHPDRGFQWLRDNYAALVGRIPAGSAVYLVHVSEGCSLERLERARAFFAEPTHSVAGTDIEMAKVAEGVKDCAGLRSREGAAAARYLRQAASTGL